MGLAEHSIDGEQNPGDTRDGDAASTAAPELSAQVDEAASAPVTAVPPLPEREPDDEPDDEPAHAGTGEVPTVPIPTTRPGTLRLEILRGTATLTLLSDEQPTTSMPVPIPDGGVIAQLLTLLALEPAGMRKETSLRALWPEAKNPPASLNTTRWGSAADHQKRNRLEERLAEIGTKPQPRTAKIAYRQQVANPSRDDPTETQESH